MLERNKSEQIMRALCVYIQYTYTVWTNWWTGANWETSSSSFLCTYPEQCCDLGYHASLNRALRTYLSAEYNLETSRHEGLDIIENAVDNLDPRSDRQRLMEMYPTAFCPPVKFEFQPHMGDEV